MALRHPKNHIAQTLGSVLQIIQFEKYLYIYNIANNIFYEMDSIRIDSALFETRITKHQKQRILRRCGNFRFELDTAEWILYGEDNSFIG
jgi:hypothetical protein